MICKHHSWVNELRPRQNGCYFPDDIWSYLLLNENIWISIKISLKFVPKGPIDHIPALVQIMAWHHPGNKPLPEPTMISLLSHICITLLQWVMQCYISFSVCRRNKDPPPVPMDFAKPASPVTADVELATLRDLPDSGTTHLNALYAIKWVINSCHAEFVFGNTKLCLYFLSFLDTLMAQVVEILPCGSI